MRFTRQTPGTLTGGLALLRLPISPAVDRYNGAMSKQKRIHRNGKGTAELHEAIRRAGGQIAYTKNGHMKVTGPRGTAVIGAQHGSVSRRGRENNRTTLRRWAGLEI